MLDAADEPTMGIVQTVRGLVQGLAFGSSRAADIVDACQKCLLAYIQEVCLGIQHQHVQVTYMYVVPHIYILQFCGVDCLSLSIR